MPLPAANAPADEFTQLLEAARTGSRDALGQLLNLLRRQLVKAAWSDLPAEVTGMCNPSDLGQAAAVAALEQFKEFKGSSQDEFVAWLRAILRSTAQAFLRHVRCKKRDARLEESLSAQESGGEEWLPDLTSVSAVEVAILRETALQVRSCMQVLPEPLERFTSVLGTAPAGSSQRN